MPLCPGGGAHCRDQFPALSYGRWMPCGTVSPGISSVAGDRVLDAALVMTVATETEQDGDFRYAASLLDGAVVPSGAGSAAVRALQRAFQEQAAAGTGSGVDEWLRVLAEADWRFSLMMAAPLGHGVALSWMRWLLIGVGSLRGMACWSTRYWPTTCHPCGMSGSRSPSRCP